MVLRAARTRGDRLWSFMPSATGNEHAGTRFGAPSSSTTHSRHAPVGVRSCMWQRVGTLMPDLRRAVRIVSPSRASIFWPSRLRPAA